MASRSLTSPRAAGDDPPRRPSNSAVLPSSLSTSTTTSSTSTSTGASSSSSASSAFSSASTLVPLGPRGGGTFLVSDDAPSVRNGSRPSHRVSTLVAAEQPFLLLHHHGDVYGGNSSDEYRDEPSPTSPWPPPRKESLTVTDPAPWVGTFPGYVRGREREKGQRALWQRALWPAEQ